MIRNISKDAILARNVKHCRSLLSKAIGCMFSPRLKDRALVFYFEKEIIVSLHMIFVFYPIDVLFLDKEKKVVEIKERFLPFTSYTPKKVSRFVVELQEGAIRASKTSVGNLISF